MNLMREKDSNPRPPAYEAGELPLLYPAGLPGVQDLPIRITLAGTWHPGLRASYLPLEECPTSEHQESNPDPRRYPVHLPLMEYSALLRIPRSGDGLRVPALAYRRSRSGCRAVTPGGRWGYWGGKSVCNFVSEFYMLQL